MVAAKNNIGIDAAMVGDICVGTVTTPNAPNTARVAALAAGFRKSSRSRSHSLRSC